MLTVHTPPFPFPLQLSLSGLQLLAKTYFSQSPFLFPGSTTTSRNSTGREILHISFPHSITSPFKLMTSRRVIQLVSHLMALWYPNELSYCLKLAIPQLFYFSRPSLVQSAKDSNSHGFSFIKDRNYGTRYTPRLPFYHQVCTQLTSTQ